MREFLMLIRENPENAKLSPEEMQRELEMHMQWFNTLVERGQFKDGNPLDFEGATIRGKDKIVTDGPFVESKECVSGYYFLLAEDLSSAIEIAKGCPTLDFGGAVEVREVIITGNE